MKNMIAGQRGITFISVVFVLAFIAVVTLFILRAFPLYNERIQVVAAMEAVAKRENSPKMSETDVRKAFMRAIAVTNIQRFSDKNIKDFLEVERPANRGDPKMMIMKYDATNKLFGELQLLLNVDAKVALTGPDTGEG